MKKQAVEILLDGVRGNLINFYPGPVGRRDRMIGSVLAGLATVCENILYFCLFFRWFT